MMLAEITLSTEAAVAITALLTAVSSFALWSVKSWIGDLTDQRNSWRNMALSSMSDMETLVNRRRESEGKPPLEKTRPVVPESSSPASKKQKETAGIATARETQVHLREELGLPPRKDTDVLGEMAETMKGKIDSSVGEVVESVKEAGEEMKDKVDEIQK